MPVPVDLKRIQHVCNGNSALEREIIEIYISDSEDRLAKLVQALQSGDSATARREVHTVKGASSNVGANDMQQHALAVEELCAKGPVEPSHPALGELNAAFDATRTFFNHYLEGQTNSGLETSDGAGPA